MMMTRVLTLLAAFVLLAQAAPPAVRVPWRQTPEILAGKVVVVQLENHVRIEGSWAGVTDTTFMMLIEKHSRNSPWDKGYRTVPRSALQTIRFREKRIRGRVLGTLSGFYGMTALAAATRQAPDALQGGWGVAAIVGAVGGYQLGKSFDKQLRELIPEP